jgi:hypothetical protein
MDRFEVLLEPLRVFLRQMGDFLPRLALALLVVIIGYFIAKAVKFAIVRGLRAVNFNVLTERAGIDGFLRGGGIRADGTEIVALLFYWVVVMVAMLILAFGAYFAGFIGHAVTAYCRKVQLQDAELLGRISQYAILAFVVLIALDQVNVGGDIVRQTFLIVLAGVVFALALAFGLGGKDWAAEMLERWWPRRRKP